MRAPRARILAVLGLAALAAAGAAGVALPAASAAAAERFEFAIAGIDCKECADPILRALRGVEGVRNPKLDWKKGTASVEHAPDFDRTRIKQAIGKLGFAAVFPGESTEDLQPLPPEELAGLDIISLDGKQAPDVPKLLAAGKVTVLDFHADWCSPCKLVEARLQHLMKEAGGLALRRIDIGNWDNAAARHITEQFRAEGLPYLRVYDANGQLVAALTGGYWEDIRAAIEHALGKSGARTGTDGHE